MDLTTIGPYRLERQLSRSGLSRVYAATDTRDGRQVAIKMAALPDEDPGRTSFAELFRTEAKVLASLRHPAVTEILDAGAMEDGTPYFVMEYVHGEDLSKVLDREGRLPVETALRVGRQVAGALGAAHASGYLHRDVKPQNILVLSGKDVEPWTVKLLDFGVTERVDDRTQLTRGGDYYGSTRYMSPQQIRAQPVSAAADVWALGVTLYEMVVGVPPFAGKGMAEAMAEIINAEVQFPPGVNVPEPLVRFLRRALAKDAGGRPMDGREAEREIARLESLLSSSTDGSAMEPPPASMAAPPMPVGAVLPVEPPAGGRSAGAGRWIALTLAAVIAAGAIVYFLAPAGVPPPTAMPPGTPATHPVHRGHAWSGVLLGVGLTLAGVLIGSWVRRLLAGKTSTISAKATEVLSGARSRDELSRTMAIQVDDIAAQCRLADERFLATTMAVMVDEFGHSTTFDDRQKALMNAVALLEKLNAKLSPWYVRYDKLIALGVTLVGVISGLVTIVQNVAKLMKGS